MQHDLDGRTERRQFLCVTTGTVFLELNGARFLQGDQPQRSAHGLLQSRTKTTRALGTDVSIAALHTDADVAVRAIDQAFAELRSVEALMSIYQADSQLSRLNRERVLDAPHPYFVQVLQAAEKMSRDSDGAFDITVQPLWSLFAAAKKDGRLPDDDAIEAARQRVDWRQVEVTPKRIRLHGEAAITLNGIAQGFAADQAKAALRKGGVKNALINTGEISSVGTKANGERWTIGVQHPRREDSYASLAELFGRCLATSGDYATAFSDDLRHNHLFDPQTGLSPSELCSVSVVAPTAQIADALSTAIFVLGMKQGLSLIEKFEATDALLISKEGKLHATPGFPFHA